jgi:transcriptional regulator with XRE-family HTH domain
MPKTMVEEFTSTPEGMAAFQQERAILEVTMLIRKILKEENLTKSDLANRMGRSKAYITQLLDGRANMTVRTISDVMTALGRSLHFTQGALSVSASPTVSARAKPASTYTLVSKTAPAIPRDVIASMPMVTMPNNKPYGADFLYESPYAGRTGGSLTSGKEVA